MPLATTASTSRTVLSSTCRTLATALSKVFHLQVGRKGVKPLCLISRLVLSPRAIPRPCKPFLTPLPEPQPRTLHRLPSPHPTPPLPPSLSSPHHVRLPRPTLRRRLPLCNRRPRPTRHIFPYSAHAAQSPSARLPSQSRSGSGHGQQSRGDDDAVAVRERERE